MSFQTAFITGASSGLGRGLALHYARHGTTVYAAARRVDALESLVAEAKDASGKIVPVELDVANTDALVAAIRNAEAASGGALDLVIANAGTSQSGRKIQDQKLEPMAQLFDINVRAACLTITAALPAMVAKKSGTVVGISSIAAWRGLPVTAAYSASKAALDVFLESCRVDLHGTGVHALTIYPGFVKTELTAKRKKKMPFLMELDDAVRIMARGIDRGQARIAFPWQTATVMRTVGALPGWLYERFAD